ncbi:MAG: glutaredoxin family protein [Anaerolineales bacterium]|nr:glutaredoxin family protein [Anaerolineales bacterium]
MSGEKTLLMYSRTVPCPDCSRTRQLLEENAVPFDEIMIDQDPAARALVEQLTGFLAVPTLVVARPNERRPLSPPRALEPGRSPRGVDRGPVITEPDMVGLRRWLAGHGFLAG